MREFDTGATRDSDDGKLDFEGFLSHPVLVRYAQYMHKHRIQADGGLRASDNWQKGIPQDAYMKSMFRHFMDLWACHRGRGDLVLLEESLCAVLFNAMGYLHEHLAAVQEHMAAPPSVNRMEEYNRAVTESCQNFLGDATPEPEFEEPEVWPAIKCLDCGTHVPARAELCPKCKGYVR